MQPKDSALRWFPFPWERNPAFLTLTQWIKYWGKSVHFLLSFLARKNWCIKCWEKWAARKSKQFSSYHRIPLLHKSTHKDRWIYGIPFSLGRNTGQEVYCLQSAPTPRWKNLRVSFSLRKVSCCILGLQWGVPTSLLLHYQTSSHLINDSDIGFLNPFRFTE